MSNKCTYFRASSEVQHVLIPNPNPHGMAVMAVALKYVHILTKRLGKRP